MSDTVSWIELCWTGAALIGLLRSGGRCWRYYRLYRGCPADAGLRLVAFMRVENQAFLAVIFEAWLGVGLIAMMRPEPPGTETTLEGVALSAILVLTSVLLWLKGEAADQNLERLAAMAHDKGDADA